MKVLVPSQTDLAWAAGFIDGEGTIAISKQSHHRGTLRTPYLYGLFLKAGQKSDKPLLKLREILGGSVWFRNHDGGNWVWCMGGKSALAAIRLLQPYLICKSAHASLAIDFSEKRDALRHKDVRPGFGYSSESLAVIDSFYQQMRYLQIKGVRVRKYA